MPFPSLHQIGCTNTAFLGGPLWHYFMNRDHSYLFSLYNKEKRHFYMKPINLKILQKSFEIAHHKTHWLPKSQRAQLCVREHCTVLSGHTSNSSRSRWVVYKGLFIQEETFKYNFDGQIRSILDSITKNNEYENGSAQMYMFQTRENANTSIPLVLTVTNNMSIC